MGCQHISLQNNAFVFLAHQVSDNIIEIQRLQDIWS